MRSPIVEADLATILTADLPWSQLAGKTVLITGAAGFLPAYMVETLLYLNEQQSQAPVQVLGLVRHRERALERFGHYGDRPDFHLITADICQPLALPGPIHYIIHAASQASPRYFGTDPVGTLSPNVLGTHYLLELARERGVLGFLFFSSSEIYGQVAADQIPIQEDSYGYLNLGEIRNCYAEGKRLGETLCHAWAHQYGVPTRTVRIFHTYGPGMRLDDGRVYADFVAAILQGQDLVLKSDGSAIRSFCYLGDAVQGFFTVLLRGAAGQAYNLGNPSQEMTVLALAQKLVNLFPEKHLQVKAQAPGQASHQISRSSPRYYPDWSVRLAPYHHGGDRIFEDDRKLLR